MIPLPFGMSRLQALLAGLGLLAVTALAAGAGGYVVGHRSAQAVGEAALAKLQRDHARAVAGAADQARLTERALTIAANRLGAQLDAERDTHTQESDQLKRRIASVTSQYRQAPGAPLQPAPRCVFTNGFAGVWNGAIGAGPMPPADPAGAAADPAGAAEALDSGIRQADVLGHIADYGLRCRDIESQLNRLIDWNLKAGAQ